MALRGVKGQAGDRGSWWNPGLVRSNDPECFQFLVKKISLNLLLLKMLSIC
jgi:hypothetical protein